MLPGLLWLVSANTSEKSNLPNASGLRTIIPDRFRQVRYDCKPYGSSMVLTLSATSISK